MYNIILAALLSGNFLDFQCERLQLTLLPFALDFQPITQMTCSKVCGKGAPENISFLQYNIPSSMYNNNSMKNNTY